MRTKAISGSGTINSGAQSREEGSVPPPKTSTPKVSARGLSLQELAQKAKRDRLNLGIGSPPPSPSKSIPPPVPAIPEALRQAPNKKDNLSSQIVDSISVICSPSSPEQIELSRWSLDSSDEEKKDKGLKSVISGMNVSIGNALQNKLARKIAGQFPDSSGVKDFCRRLQEKGIDAHALQDLKDAIDGKHDLATAPALSRITDKTIASALVSAMRPATAPLSSGGVNAALAGAIKKSDWQQQAVHGIDDVSDQMKTALRKNRPIVRDRQIRERAEVFMTQLLCLSHKNTISGSTDGFKKLEPELKFWSKAEEILLAQGVPKEAVVEARAGFLADMRAWKDKQQHIANIAQRCLHANQFIHMTGEPSLDEVIDAYVQEKNRDGNNFPSDEEIEGLRATITKLSDEAGLQDIDIYKGDAGHITPAAQKAYLETTKRIEDKYNKAWKDPWDKDQSDKAFQNLHAWPRDLVDELRGMELQTLMSPEKKTKFMEEAAREGGDFLRPWRFDAALSETNKVSGNVKLTAEDAVRIRDWMSLYLGKAIARMQNQAPGHGQAS